MLGSSRMYSTPISPSRSASPAECAAPRRRKRAGAAIQRQIVQSDVQQEAYPGLNLLKDLPRNGVLTLRQSVRSRSSAYGTTVPFRPDLALPLRAAAFARADFDFPAVRGSVRRYLRGSVVEHLAAASAPKNSADLIDW